MELDRIQTARIFQKLSLRQNFENKDKIEVQVIQCNLIITMSL